jgi:hypothetical protein
LADIVREFIPDAQITFESESGFEDSGTDRGDNSCRHQGFEIQYPPFRTHGLEIINGVRCQEGLPLIEAR